MKPYQAFAEVVVTDAEQSVADLKGQVSPAGYSRLYLSKAARVVVTVAVDARIVTVFDGQITPAAGKAAPVEIRVRRHPDVKAAPPEPQPSSGGTPEDEV
jgi:hypothetical protein